MNRPLIALLSALTILSVALVACSPPSGNQVEELTTPTGVPPTITASPTAMPDPTEAQPKAATTPKDIPDYEIITLLPRDGIPAIFDPEFLTVEEANEEYSDSELVLGVEIDGDARAYSIPYLSSREIVNDTVGGRHIAATW